MYELYHVCGNSYYIQSPAKIGLVKLNENDVCIIDSGNDKEAGRKIKKILDTNGWHLTAVYNTHSNADHIGGNAYLQNNTGCDIFAPQIECDFTNHPILESAFLYGGFPPSELKHKFLMAKPSLAKPVNEDNLPKELSIIKLPGHFFDMVGFCTKDDVVYIADCLSSKATLDKYGITFIYDVEGYLNTLEAVKTMKAKFFIPAHADVTENIAELAQYNIDKVHEIADKILDICKVPISFEKILQKLFFAYNIQMNFEQYALVGSTVRSYLSWLKNLERLTVSFENNELLWAAS